MNTIILRGSGPQIRMTAGTPACVTILTKSGLKRITVKDTVTLKRAA